jgi:Ca-activated chloride channel family protein
MAVEVGKIRASGGTNIYDALVQGFESLDHADLSDSTISRVVLYSDGEANQGLLKDAEGLAQTVQQYRKKASVSAFGYGLGADQLLMGALAEVGQGNYAHITAPDDSLTVFARELGGLLSTYAQDIKVSVKVCNDFGPLEVITDLPFTTEEGGSGVTLDLGSLLAEEARHIVLRVGLKGGVVPRETNALEIGYSCRTLDGAGKAQNEGGQVTTKILRVRGAESGEVNKDLSRIVALAELQQVQKRAEVAVKAGRHQEAQAMFVSYGANLSADHHDLQEGANRMAGLYTETAYGSQEGRAAVATTKGVVRRRSAVLLADSSNINLVSDAQVGASVFNSAQEAMTKSFLTSLHEKHMAAVPAVPPTNKP